MENDEITSKRIKQAEEFTIRLNQMVRDSLPAMEEREMPKAFVIGINRWVETCDRMVQCMVRTKILADGDEKNEEEFQKLAHEVLRQFAELHAIETAKGATIRAFYRGDPVKVGYYDIQGAEPCHGPIFAAICKAVYYTEEQYEGLQKIVAIQDT